MPNVKCSDCGTDLIDEKIPCPNCGSKKRTFFVSIEENIELHDRVEVKEISNSLSQSKIIYQNDELPEIQVITQINSKLISFLKSHPNEIRNINPRMFEELVAELLAYYNWNVTITPKTKDGGYDIWGITIDKSGLKSHWLIECKKYKEENKVGIEIIKQIYATKMDLKVANALIATTSFFTKGAKEFKRSRYDLELRDFNALIDWINEYKPNPEGKLYIKDNTLHLNGK